MRKMIKNAFFNGVLEKIAYDVDLDAYRKGLIPSDTEQYLTDVPDVKIPDEGEVNEKEEVEVPQMSEKELQQLLLYLSMTQGG